MVACKVFIEGGGDYRELHIEAREAFYTFFSKAGIPVEVPILPIACGGRRQAYQDFCKAIRNGENAFLLVDSEDLVGDQHQDKPWQHLAQRKGDEWIQPQHTTDSHCHLMVACMESWFLADKEALKSFFGQEFDENALPAHASIEAVDKSSIYTGMQNASRNCSRTDCCYKKGAHSFKILALLDPAKVTAASPWAQRFIDALKSV